MPLERELGTPVIERLPRGIRWTAAGLAAAEARTGSPRTAAQLAAAGMGVTIVPSSALIPLPDGTIRPFDPPELRDVIATVAAPHDDLLRGFVADLKRRGLPAIRVDTAGMRMRIAAMNSSKPLLPCPRHK